MFAHKLVGSLVLLCGLIVLVGVKRPLSAHAQSGCALHINEIMYDPAPGLDADAQAEWVELFVAQDIAVDTTYFITDQEAYVAGIFARAFTLPAGTAAGSFVVIHNDGNPADDNPTSSPIEFYMGNRSVKLNNTGDEVVLYQGGDATGVPCDYVEFLTPNSPMPAGFSWDTSGCPNLGSSQDYGTSISLDPNGVDSDSSCDWAESGLNSPNDPGVPFTGGPHTQGYTNTIAPTAVSLASFTATKSHPANAGISIAFVMMAALTGWGWFKHRK